MVADDQDIAFAAHGFRRRETLSGAFGADAAEALLMAAGDVSLILDQDGLILDSAVTNAELSADGAGDWPGQKFNDLVTVESRPKVRELLADAAAGKPARWRQLTHATPNGNVAVRYACVAAGERIFAIGRDLRQTAAMQQRLLQAQQSLERDYLRLRQAESRYRLLFDMSDEAVLIVEAATRRIMEANTAAHRLLGADPGDLVRQPATAIVSTDEEEKLVARLGAASAGAVEPMQVTLRIGGTARLTATPFRQDRAVFLLVRLATGDMADADTPTDAALREVVERMPDAFVLADQQLTIITCNNAFIELIQAVSVEAITGIGLGDWLGRPGIDLELVAAQMREHGVARNVATILGGMGGVREEVELSGVLVEAGGASFYGFIIRGVARRVRDLPPVRRDLPRSTEQLTELVGRMSLKDIVRESTDLIERLCIEAALSYTSDNRASAAEILGLSRQGLYSKLHRHGLGNLIDERG